MDLDQRPDPGPNPKGAARGPRAWEQPHPWAALIQTWSGGTEFPSSPGPVVLAGAVQTEGHPLGQFPALQGRRDGDMVGELILIPAAAPQPLACWRGHKMAWQSHPGAAAFLAPPAPCPPPHSPRDLVGCSRREGVPCPTVTWGFLSPPHLPKPRLVPGILGCSYPPQRCSVGVREHRDPERVQELMCCWGSGPAHAPPSKAFVPPLCSWLQTQPVAGRDPASSPRIPGAAFRLRASMGAGTGGPHGPGTQPPQSRGTGGRPRGAQHLTQDQSFRRDQMNICRGWLGPAPRREG